MPTQPTDRIHPRVPILSLNDRIAAEVKNQIKRTLDDDEGMRKRFKQAEEDATSVSEQNRSLALRLMECEKRLAEYKNQQDEYEKRLSETEKRAAETEKRLDETDNLLDYTMAAFGIDEKE